MAHHALPGLEADPDMRIRVVRLFLGAALGLAAVAVWLGGEISRSTSPAAERGYFLAEPMPAPGFVLTSQEGQRVSSTDFRDKVLVVFFGYTSCPDVCPLTLSKLARAFRLMDEDGDRIQVALITVDPSRDTPIRLERYLANFHPSFLGLTGTVEDIRAVAEGFGAYFSNPPEGEEKESYTVDHTARTFVIDPSGHIPLTFPVTATADEMARDLTALLNGRRP